MKKSLVLASILSISLFAKVDFNDEKTIDKMGFACLQNEVKSLDKTSLGNWYLRHITNHLYYQVKDDEFEYDDAIENSAKSALEEIKKEQSFIGQESSVNVNASFGKYDFKKKQFPLELLSNNSYLAFSGEHIVYSRGMHLSFDNIDSKHAILPMKKKDAKQFIKNRKHNGSVNRNLTARYYFTIKKLTTTQDQSIEGIKGCKKDSYRCGILHNLNAVGHITKLEIIDTKNNKVLQTYTDYK